MKKTLAILLLAALLTCLASCSGDPNTPGGTASGTTAAAPTDVSVPVRVSEAELPEIEDLTDWYALAAAREYIPNALIYSKTEGLWHCWLYLGGYLAGDSVTVTESGGIFLINATLQNDESLGAEGVFYFTVASEAEPSFELLIGNDSAGLILTLADTSLVK